MSQIEVHYKALLWRQKCNFNLFINRSNSSTGQCKHQMTNFHTDVYKHTIDTHKRWLCTRRPCPTKKADRRSWRPQKENTKYTSQHNHVWPLCVFQYLKTEERGVQLLTYSDYYADWFSAICFATKWLLTEASTWLSLVRAIIGFT